MHAAMQVSGAKSASSHTWAAIIPSPQMDRGSRWATQQVTHSLATKKPCLQQKIHKKASLVECPSLCCRCLWRVTSAQVLPQLAYLRSFGGGRGSRTEEGNGPGP